MDRPSITAFGAGVALASSVAVMAVSGLGVISVVPAATTDDTQIQGAQAEGPTARRCGECGWIDSARDIPSDADNRAIRIREYTVRMADGSRRTFTSDVHWRIGERLYVVARDDRPAG